MNVVVVFSLVLFAFCSKAYSRQLLLNCAAASCPENACRETSCPAFPNAVCYTDECGCNPRFYVNNQLVDCERRQIQLPQQQQQQRFCQNPVDCWANPCQVNSCRAYPEATCVANYCGGCHANFYVNGQLVDCERRRGSLEPYRIDGECPLDWLATVVQCPQRGPNDCNQCEQRGQLCCSHGCGQKCKEPVRRQLVPIQGQCPYDDLATRVRCFSPQTDECKGHCEQRGQLCCSHGCSKICKDPVTFELPKPIAVEPTATRECPIDYLGMVVICARPIRDECHGQCQGQGKICCVDGCRRICKYPEIRQAPKPEPNVNNNARCPQVVPGSLAICTDLCNNCEANDQICCSNGCGRVCMSPINIGG